MMSTVARKPALRLSETDDMPELSYGRKAPIENAGAGRVDDLVDAFASRKRHHGCDEILVLAIDHLGR